MIQNVNTRFIKGLKSVPDSKRVSFFDRKLTEAQKVMEFSFWKKSNDFELNSEIINNPQTLKEKLRQNDIDILIAFTDGNDFFSPDQIPEIINTFTKIQIIVIGHDSSYKTVRNYFIKGAFDYLLEPIEEHVLEESVFKMYEHTGVDYIVNSLKLKTTSLIDNIFLGGGNEEYIIQNIINQIYDDWKAESVTTQIVANRAKSYIYETLIDRKPWIEKFIFKPDFIYHFGFSIKSKDEIITSWVSSFTEVSKVVKKYQMVDDKLTYKIGKYVLINVDKKLSLSDVSEGVFLNPSYISHIFKKITGMSFIDYINDVKIDRAKVLLRDSYNRVNEVSETLGYSSQEYFTRIFKKKTGLTPSNFQEKTLKSNKD